MPVPADLAFASLPALGRGLRAKQFTSVELTKFFLDRLDTIGPQFNAVVTVTRERALEEAAQADRDLADGKDRGPLHGIPYGAKDLLATRGIPTSVGCRALPATVSSTRDATVIRRLREAGAVLAAKLAMVEIAGGMGYKQADASFTGPGLNPWDKKSWSGGSSSGSGAAVAAGLVPFAIGSETSGSIMARRRDIAASLACVRPSGRVRPARRPCASVGRWTSSGRFAAPPKTAGTCWRPSPAPIRRMKPPSIGRIGIPMSDRWNDR